MDWIKQKTVAYVSGRSSKKAHNAKPNKAAKQNET